MNCAVLNASYADGGDWGWQRAIFSSAAETEELFWGLFAIIRL